MRLYELSIHHSHKRQRPGACAWCRDQSKCGAMHIRGSQRLFARGMRHPLSGNGVRSLRPVVTRLLERAPQVRLTGWLLRPEKNPYGG